MFDTTSFDYLIFLTLPYIPNVINFWEARKNLESFFLFIEKYKQNNNRDAADLEPFLKQSFDAPAIFFFIFFSGQNTINGEDYIKTGMMKRRGGRKKEKKWRCKNNK